ncbi:hypothetical protein D3C81_1141540 [compost metagenome]
MIALAEDAAAIRGGGVGEATLVGALQQPRAYLQVDLVDLACSYGPTAAARAQQLRHRRERHRETLDTAIGFGQLDVQVAAVAGGVEVVDGKRARCHRCVVDHIAALADDQTRIGLGDATHYRRITATGLWVHAAVASQACSQHAHAVEQLARGERVTEGQLRAQSRNVVLQGSAGGLITAASVQAPTQRACMGGPPTSEAERGL